MKTTTDSGISYSGVFIAIVALAVAASLCDILTKVGHKPGPQGIELFALNMVLVLSGLTALVSGALLLFAWLTSSELPPNPSALQRVRHAIWQFL